MRIVAIADQHGHFPAIPPCDLLIVAGDQCIDNFLLGPAYLRPDLQWQWFLKKWLPWREKQPAKDCIVTWGNHDFCGEDHPNETFLSFHTRIVCDEAIVVEGLKLYLTPWSNQFRQWAFMKQPEVLGRYYQGIPEGLDILVSHQPPMGFGGRIYDMRNRSFEELGSKELLDVIKLKRPKLVICGHIHAAYGQYYLLQTDVAAGPLQGEDVQAIPIYNVSVVNEAYENVNPVTVIDL